MERIPGGGLLSRYAASTEVPADRSRAEIEQTLARYGAHGFLYGWEEIEGGRRAVVGFRMEGRHIRFELAMPSPSDPQFTRTAGRGLERSESAAKQAYEQATRQRWRALALVVKAKLEAVDSGIATFEEEFLAYVVMPDGKTVGAHTLPRIAEAYSTGEMPKLLPAAPEGGPHA
jgi:hypothetical protein